MQPTPTLQQERSTTWIVIIVALLVVGGLCWWLWTRQTEGGSAEATVEAAPTEPAAKAAVRDEPAGEPAAPAAPRDEWAAAVTALPDFSWPPDRSAAIAAREDLLRALARLDPGAGGAGLYARLSAAAIALADHPPAAGEIRDPLTLLANVLHLARVLGKRRTVEFKTLVGASDVDTETLAAALYTWLLTREAAEDPRERSITLERLYAYAGWLLDSVGGRALLARRQPRHEALAEFYALVTVDLARRAQISSRGTDPRPHFARCRRLIETQRLDRKQAYLDALERVESRW
ncbi:MAG: hypothetical protein Q9Q40_14040 [Acidobacteriota bacterium]|nr:hypothetical protein [Acidobacteriota bacterium]